MRALLQFDRLDDVLFEDDHPDVKMDISRRLYAVQKAQRKTPQKQLVIKEVPVVSNTLQKSVLLQSL